MIYRIHQIKDIGNTIYAFRRYNPNAFDYADYKCVYEGEIECEDRTLPEICEVIYYIFNMRHPDDFRGHSLSMSDIIELTVNDKSIYYYCDICGFQRLPQPAQKIN